MDNKVAVSPVEARHCIRVFLIDDHRMMLWGLEKLIDGERPRMTVVGRATGIPVALDEVESLATDVVLLDIDRGEENGLDLIKRLTVRPRPKVLVLTGLRDSSLHDKAIIAGALGVVTKAEPPETILRAIQKVHDGELWLHNAATSRVLSELRRGTGQQRSNPEQQKLSTLTLRERQVLSVLAANIGARGKEVADLLHISEHTLRHHCTSIYEKLGVSTRLEVLAYMLQRRGVEGPPGKTGIARSLENSVDDDVDRGVDVV